MQLRYAFRLYPDATQQAALARAFGCARVVYNDAVRAREDAREAGRPFPTAGQLSRQLVTEAKQTPERAWLGEVSAVVLQQSLRDAEMAYRNFFASLKGTRKGPKLGPPRFKSRKDNRQSIRFTANARWSITDSGRLSLPKIGTVKVKWSRTLPATPTSVTVIKDAAGRFFASFVLDTDPAADQARMPDTDRAIGIDLGLTHFAVLSDGTKIDSPRFLRRAEKKLKKAHKELSRKLKGSKNRAKAREKVARAHAKVADARREFHHQLSTRLISENQGIAVEDLSVAGLARTRLAKSVHDAGWAQFISMLTYKAQRYGRTLVPIGRFEPTSQVCSTCGAKDGPKPLSIREWICSACGTVHDRDHNAALNIKTAAGLAATACGAPVRPGAIPAQREETGSHGFPDRKPCRVTAQQPVREGQNPRPSEREASQFQVSLVE
ncbi:RNA-guided endonuclease InsQ/TnpB family protein [Streptomyces cylindrosporus]|uniref:Transposase n=1 Tax=Streptomyces cylindrosporus TaxID=2927583 RepID=A0ABS9XZ10_9ACTN|nr:transposase [Streptomyces cylindrosporus]MCI3270200.1 transposase [Streptomyces cylindrosporus]